MIILFMQEVPFTLEVKVCTLSQATELKIVIICFQVFSCINHILQAISPLFYFLYHTMSAGTIGEELQLHEYGLSDMLLQTHLLAAAFAIEKAATIIPSALVTNAAETSGNFSV